MNTASDLPNELRNYPAVAASVLRGRSAFLAGIGTIGVGVYILLVSMEIVQGGKVHVPMWVLGVIGGLFSFVGFLFIVQSGVDLVQSKKSRRAIEQYPDEPWRGDFDWSKACTPKGMDSRERGRRWMNLLALPVVICFSIVAHAIAHTDSSVFIFIMALFCDLFVIIFASISIRSFLMAHRYGPVRIAFDHIPIRPGGMVEARVICPKGFKDAKELTVTFRYVIETIEKKGPTNQKQKQVIVCYEHYREDYVIDDVGGQYGSGDEFPVLFEVPTDAQSCELVGRPAKYWDIEIRRATRGVDLVQRFVVPVYGQARGQVAADSA